MHLYWVPIASFDRSIGVNYFLALYKYIQIYIFYISIILTAVNCGTLTDPANGQVDHTAGTSFGQTATYSCDPGYNLVGNNTRICHATGVWSGSAPTCQGICC